MARRRKIKVRGPVALLAALIAAAVAYWTSRRPPQGVPTQAVITQVVDGDTLHIEAGGVKHTLRLIGVDTPELHESDKLERDAERTKRDKRTIQALGKRAKEFTRRLCDGKPCRLEYDPANTSGGHRDRYDRLLVYVFVAGDGGLDVMVNAEIIRCGYGAAMTGYPFDAARKEEFLALQREASSAKRGLWAEWKARPAEP